MWFKRKNSSSQNVERLMSEDGDNEENLSPGCIGKLRQRVVDALRFYSQYHQDPTNQKIHTVCIPLIMWTSMVWLSQVPLTSDKDLIDYLNLTNLLSIGYFAGYTLYEPKLGIVSGALLTGMAIGAKQFASHVPYANYIAIVIHVTGWLAQLLGHHCCEHNRPALLQSLVQALYIAPLFSVIEASESVGCTLITSKESLFQNDYPEIVEGIESDDENQITYTQHT